LILSLLGAIAALNSAMEPFSVSFNILLALVSQIPVFLLIPIHEEQINLTYYMPVFKDEFASALYPAPLFICLLFGIWSRLPRKAFNIRGFNGFQSALIIMATISFSIGTGVLLKQSQINMFSAMQN
jgi:hypothetical protein